jgi:outer membrane protein assembly factor BamB
LTYALDPATGAILWRFAADSSVNSGPSVVDGTVYQTASATGPVATSTAATITAIGT